MATTFLEPGGDADFGFGLWSSETNATIVSDIIHGGHQRSIRFPPNTNGSVLASSVVSTTAGRYSIYIYFVALPHANPSVPIVLNQSGVGNTIVAVNVTTAGILQLLDNNGTQIGSNGSTISTGVWYRFSLAFTITSSTVNQFNFFLNGIQNITKSNYSLPVTSPADLNIGNLLTDTTMDFRISDIYVDNSNALTDPGNIWVTAKRPFANGTTNGFTTRIGTGGSGYGSGHSPQVNERPNSDTNGWSIAGAGSAITEEYNIEGKSVGDINIQDAKIVDYRGWIRSKSLSSETANIIVNGTTTNVSLTSTTKFFTQIAGSTTYPAGTGSDIGEISSTTVTTVSLYECGIVVAFIPPPLHLLSLLGVGT